MYALVESPNVLSEALDRVNERYEGNIVFKRGPEYKSNGKAGRARYLFTLTVADSAEPGARRSREGRRIAAACWHVHGHFFDALFDIDPGAIVKTSIPRANHTITADQGNWQDCNIGSAYYPFYFSEACECE